jgi:hypothetical protein
LALSTMNKTILNILIVAALALLIISCEDPTSDESNDIQITTLIYHLVPKGTRDTVSLEYQDLDGEGGEDPIIKNRKLDTNIEYFGYIELLDENHPNPEKPHERVDNNTSTYQFFYELSDTSNHDISYIDSDPTGFPVGLTTVFLSGSGNTERLNIRLYEELDKSASGPDYADTTSIGGKRVFKAELLIRLKD